MLILIRLGGCLPTSLHRHSGVRVGRHGGSGQQRGEGADRGVHPQRAGRRVPQCGRCRAEHHVVRGSARPLHGAVCSAVGKGGGG
jgi:hypothetical protein